MAKKELNLLIIDDNPDDREVYRRLFKKDTTYSYNFLEAETGRQGLDMFSGDDIDCVILDYRLPDFDGLEVLKQMEETEKSQDIPVVFVTGQGSEETAVQAMEAGAKDYLVKDNLTIEKLLDSLGFAIHEMKEEPEEPIGNRLKTLIVEDDQSIVALYDKFLSDAVFVKKFISNGKEGLAVYKEWKPDLLLMDIMLPGMTGYSILKEIRQSLGDVKTPIIMVTTIARRESILDCVQLGIQGYIVKPFNHKQLSDRILEFFSTAQPERAKEFQDKI